MKQKPTPNPTNSSIKCDVNSCTHHSSNNYCSLNQIEIGPCVDSPINAKNTECASFEYGTSEAERESIYGQGSN